MKKIAIILIVLINVSFILRPNLELSTIIGIYSDKLGDSYTTRIELKDDSTFDLETVDQVFPYTHKQYRNFGKFEIDGEKIILNPDKSPRKVKVNLNQDKIENDSIFIQIDYIIQEFEDEELSLTKQFDFDLLTIYLDKKRNDFNLVRNYGQRGCSFTPRTKNQFKIDRKNQISINKRNIERIGIYSYGFHDVFWFDVKSNQINKFHFKIEQSIDKERTPRSKLMEFEKKKAFFYERNGKIDKQLTPLIKEK